MQSHVLWEFSCAHNHLAFHLFSPQSLYLPLKKSNLVCNSSEGELKIQIGKLKVKKQELARQRDLGG